MTTRPIAGDPFAGLRDQFEVQVDGDGLVTRCQRCGFEEHYSPAYHPSVVLVDCDTHRYLCKGAPGRKAS